MNYSKRRVEPLLTDVSSRLSADLSPTRRNFFDSNLEVIPQSEPVSTSQSRKESFGTEAVKIPSVANLPVSEPSVAGSHSLSRLSFLNPFKRESATGRGSVNANKRIPGARKSTLKTRGVVTDSLSVPLNKMSLKLYGSKKAVQEEQQRLEQAGSWIIHPYSNFRLLWDCSTLVLLLVNITLIPVAITFWKVDQPGWLPFKVCLF